MLRKKDFFKMTASSLKTLNHPTQWIMASYRFQRWHTRVGFTIKGIRFYGTISILLLVLLFLICITIPAVYHGWRLFPYIAGCVLLACGYWISQMIATFLPRQRAGMEAVVAKMQEEDEQSIQLLIATA